MAYRLKADESVEDGIKRVCTDQVERALNDLSGLDDADLDLHQTVHKVRKRCKKVRGALRLVRPILAGDDTYRRENTWFRDAARRISEARDVAVLVDTLDELVDRFADVLDTHAFIAIRSRFAQRRRRIAASEELQEQLRQFRARMVIATERIDGWRLRAEGFDAIRPGLEKTYRRARKRFPEAYESGAVEAFHQWRKRVKYHWYHCRLLQDLHPEVIGARRDDADRLADVLGDEHDLAVFHESLEEDQASFGDERAVDVLQALAWHRRDELRRIAKGLGEGLLVESPSALSRRLEPLWISWHCASSG